MNKNFSINQEEEVSLHVNQSVYNMYEESIDKGGFLSAFDQIKKTIVHLEDERETLIKNMVDAEKWFKKGIELIYNHRPYREKQDKDEEMTSLLVSEYPKIEFKKVENTYSTFGWTHLSDMIHYLEKHSNYLEQVTLGNVWDNGISLKEAIYLFDRSNLEKERLLDLKNLILKNGIGRKVDKKEFYGINTSLLGSSEDQLVERKKPGPKTPDKLLDDIDSILDEASDKNHDLSSTSISLFLDLAKANKAFSNRWVDKESDKLIHSYSERQLITLFNKQLKKKMKSSNSS